MLQLIQPLVIMFLWTAIALQSKAYADAEDAEFQLGADLEERGGMVSMSEQQTISLDHPEACWGCLNRTLSEDGLGYMFSASQPSADCV